MQSFPEEADRVRARAEDERNRSRDATVTKLLHARTAVRTNASRSALSPSVMQGLEQEPDPDAGEHPGSPRLAPLSRDKSIPDDNVVVLDPFAAEIDKHHPERECFPPEKLQDDDAGKQAQSTSGLYRSPTQQTVLIQAREKAQGMILSLREAMSTLDALTQIPKPKKAMR